MTCIYYGGPQDGRVVFVPNDMKVGEFYEDAAPEGIELYFLRQDEHCRHELVFQGYQPDNVDY